MVTGLLLSQTVCLDQWKRSIPLGRCLAASWQRRCRRSLSNGRIDVSSLYGPLMLLTGSIRSLLKNPAASAKMSQPPT
jgi:hypothetical protein